MEIRLHHGHFLQPDVYLDGYRTKTKKLYYRQFLWGSNLEDVEHMFDDDVKDDCTRYVKQSNSTFPNILTPIKRQKLKYLFSCVKYQVRFQEVFEFPNGTTQAQFQIALETLLNREKTRK